MAAGRGNGKKYTTQEWVEHRAVALFLLQLPRHTDESVVRELRKRFGCGRMHAESVVRKVIEEWVRGVDPRNAAKNRAQTARRLREDIQDATFELDPATGLTRRRKVVNYSQVARLEATLMRVEGTDQPIVVEHWDGVELALRQAAQQLTPEQRTEMLAEARRTRRLADLARARLPEAIDVDGVEVP